MFYKIKVFGIMLVFKFCWIFILSFGYTLLLLVVGVGGWRLEVGEEKVKFFSNDEIILLFLIFIISYVKIIKDLVVNFNFKGD